MDLYFEAARKYGYHKQHPATYLMMSRGCPGSCTYCATAHRKFRQRSPEPVVAEIEHLHERYGVREIYFYDDTFNLSKSWLYEFREHLKCAGLLGKLSFRCLIRADRGMLPLLKELGVYMIGIGVESGSPDVLRRINKKVHPRQVEATYAEAKRLGMYCQGTFMVGIPGEIEADRQMTVDLIKRLPLNYFSMAICALYPGTKLWEKYHRGDWLKENPKHFATGGIAAQVDTVLGGFRELLEEIRCEMVRKGFRRHWYRHWKYINDLAHIPFKEKVKRWVGAMR
jgi:radical SAM superfamily enzyme YgiQ (UPF0313 family)